MAIRVYALANGREPASLAELVPALLPAVPVDPYSGKPLVYRLDPKGFVLYSVGPNGRDDGGVHFEWRKKGMPEFRASGDLFLEDGR